MVDLFLKLRYDFIACTILIEKYKMCVEFQHLYKFAKAVVTLEKIAKENSGNTCRQPA